MFRTATVGRPGPAERPEPAHERRRRESDPPLLEIPYAIRWLVPKGERFANFDILNDNDTQLEYYRRYGHIYAVGVPTKKWRLIVVSDPALLDEIAANEEQFGKPVEEINFFAQLKNSRGTGISVIGDGEHYDRIRRVMLPWYSPLHQRTQLERMKEQARKLVDRWSELPDDDPVDARAWMERYTLEVSGRGACSYDFGLLEANGSCPHAFAEAVPQSTKESILRVAEPRPDLALFARRDRRKRLKRYREQNRHLIRTADALVRARMHTVPLGQQTDLLSRLVSTPDEETGELLDEVTIRDQVLMHLSNGFNGPSITGAWLCYVLASHPEVEKRVFEEIDAITGGDPEYDLQYDDLMSLTYTTQVIKETLRIYPPMPVTIRRSLADGTLGRYRVRKGDIILVGTLAAQRDPRFWGPNADRFDPEQFAPDTLPDRPRHAFIPFSIGKRQCMAQEVTFMMLRVVLFEICKRYQLRLAPGATVTKNTVVTTKPASVPVVRLPRVHREHGGGRIAPRERVVDPGPAASHDWGAPTEIPQTSRYGELVVAYGSNFGANKELAERFAERGRFHGYAGEVMTLDELCESPPQAGPWLLVVMTSTYTSNPPANAAAFKTWLEQADGDSERWRNCRYLVWGLGNSQWNAFLAFPRYVHTKLAELGAESIAEFAFGDVGSPTWERLHAEWNAEVWPLLLELSEARPTEAAAKRVAEERTAAGRLTGADSNTAMTMSLSPAESAPRVLLAPKIFTNAIGAGTFEARVRAGHELQARTGPKRTRHLEVTLPPGCRYRVGDHLGICPKNDEEQVERLARHLGATLEGLFMVPKAIDVSAVPKGVVLQVRNVLTNLVDINGRPTLALLHLLLQKVSDPGERSTLEQIMRVLESPDQAESELAAQVGSGAYNVLQLLDECPSCTLNIFEFLQVVQPLRPRYYSTSSSPRIHGEDVAHLTVGLEDVAIPGLPERVFRGMSAAYVHALREGDRVSAFLDGAEGFHLQDDVAKPMIFISVGTGFAPMRAFLWERVALEREGVELGEAALFNGIRSRGLDYVYQDEIEQFLADGILDHLHLATSRESGGRVYVQDKLREQGALVWRLLTSGAYVYVCGSQAMRDGVHEAIIDVVIEHGRQPREHAEAYMQQLETTHGRYRPDLWG